MLFPKDFVKKIECILNDLKKENIELQREIVLGILNSELISEIDKKDIEIYYLIVKLYDYGCLTNKDKKIILKKLSELHSLLSSIKLDLQEVKILFGDIQNFLEHQENYLEYIPGAENKEYIKLIDLIKSKEKKLTVNKADLELKENFLFFNEKKIQGIKLREGSRELIVEIIGEHYSNKEKIKEIYSNKKIIPSKYFYGLGQDPYSYIVETGKLYRKPEKEIKKLIGAESASCSISLKIEVPLSRVWIRLKRGYPTKFAIEARELLFTAPKPQIGYRVSINNKILNWAA